MKFKKRYPFKCPKCKKDLWAAPSIMMTGFGRNSGHGTCPDCKTFFHLEIKGSLKGKEMVSMKWNDFLKREGIKPAKYIKGGEAIKIKSEELKKEMN